MRAPTVNRMLGSAALRTEGALARAQNRLRELEAYLASPSLLATERSYWQDRLKPEMEDLRARIARGVQVR